VLCALLNSFVANYLVRRRVSTHVTTAIVEALAVPRVERHSRLFQRLHDAAETLESAADPRAAADAQAAAAEAFGLTDEEYAHVLASFPLVGEAERHAAAGRFSLRRPRQSCR
jgi:hypothetical protein